MSSHVSDDDQTHLILIAAGSFGAILTSAAWFWNEVVAWLVAHQIVVSAAKSPVVALPHADGAGLDVGRIVLVIGVAVVLLALGVAGIRRKRSVRMDGRP